MFISSVSTCNGSGNVFSVSVFAFSSLLLTASSCVSDGITLLASVSTFNTQLITHNIWSIASARDNLLETHKS